MFRSEPLTVTVGEKGVRQEWHGNKRYHRWKQRCKAGYMTAPLLGVVHRVSAGGARSSVPLWEPTELPAGKQELAPRAPGMGDHSLDERR
jgi:hypothetical protein